MFFYAITSLVGQVNETTKKYVRVGSLQSHFSAYGSERAWNNSYYEGLRWPADYNYQDNSVIKRTWIACENFKDEDNFEWGNFGLYFSMDYVGSGLFPMEMKQIAKFPSPTVYVDGVDITSLYSNDVDEYDSELVADRMIKNVVNTAMGLTMERNIYAFSQQYHDNYFIKIFTFTNTGNVDWDPEIELSDSLKGVRVGWGTRYSGGREGTWNIGDGQSWGKHSMVTKRGEDYHQHYLEPITEANSIVDWLRCGFSWAGQAGRNSFDNIGGPDMSGNGRLTSPHHVGTVVIHVDKSAADRSDNPSQPVFLGWHAGDTYPSVGDLRPSDELNMQKLYEMLSGHPYQGKGGNERFDEVYVNNTDPYTVHSDGGGTNVMITYGPFDLAHGESITIVEAEGIHGLDRNVCEIVGERWKKAHDNPNDNGPFGLPGGTTTNDKEEYKNSWVYTGKDSILQTFSRAKRNYDSGFNIPQPPQPPIMFNVQSGGDRIYLSWQDSPSENETNFSGYRIYRSTGKPDTTYQLIYEGPPNVHDFEDMTAIRGYSYYYYVSAFTDGSLNTEARYNPVGSLESGRFYTKTNKPAYLRRKAGSSFSDIRVVPNPYNTSAQELQYPSESDKIMFLDIPGQCDISIYTERGDLVKIITHRDGSGDESWNLISNNRQVLVSGVYIAYIQVTTNLYNTENKEIQFYKGESGIVKFIVLR